MIFGPQLTILPVYFHGSFQFGSENYPSARIFVESPQLQSEASQVLPIGLVAQPRTKTKTDELVDPVEIQSGKLT